MLSDAAEGLRWADKPSQTSAAHGLTDKCLYPDYDMHAAKWIQMFMTHWFVLYQLFCSEGVSCFDSSTVNEQAWLISA